MYDFATGRGHPDPLLEGDEPLHIQSTSHRPRGVRQLFHRLQRSRRDQVGTWKEVGNWAASDKGANMSSVSMSVCPVPASVPSIPPHTQRMILLVLAPSYVADRKSLIHDSYFRALILTLSVSEVRGCDDR